MLRPVPGAPDVGAGARWWAISAVRSLATVTRAKEQSRRAPGDARGRERRSPSCAVMRSVAGDWFHAVASAPPPLCSSSIKASVHAHRGEHAELHSAAARRPPIPRQGGGRARKAGCLPQHKSKGPAPGVRRRAKACPFRVRSPGALADGSCGNRRVVPAKRCSQMAAAPSGVPLARHASCAGRELGLPDHC
jgi:hypothetical protein